MANHGGTYASPVTTRDDRWAVDGADCDVDPDAKSDSFDLVVGVPHEVADNWTVTWTRMTPLPYEA